MHCNCVALNPFLEVLILAAASIPLDTSLVDQPYFILAFKTSRNRFVEGFKLLVSFANHHQEEVEV